MVEIADGYESYYAAKLWQLLPQVYRAEDTDRFDANGPLRELVDRIGAQVAIVRRSIDRLWADQSLETCDDWVVPYIADLLATNLVAGIDARGHRLDVANTIHYRRRKGTVAVLEELAGDVTGWQARVVESFHRMARQRHSLDPAIGRPVDAADPVGASSLQHRQGLVGRLTGTPMGGFADLRMAHGAALAGGPFDEAFHLADTRRARGAVGRYGIPKLAAFVWRLFSLGVVQATPVPVTGCAHQYTFDPTGRSVPMFLAPKPRSDDFADTWVPSREWEVPGSLTTSLYEALRVPTPPRPGWTAYPDADAQLNGSSYSVTRDTGTFFDPVTDADLRLWPELGRFELAPAVDGTALRVDYHYGFPALIGAGPYDRRVLGDRPNLAGGDAHVAGGVGLDIALSALPAVGTVTVADSLTYTAVSDVGSPAAPLEHVLVRAGSEQRPVVRAAPAAAPWVFTGDGESTLVLDGLLVSGCDVVLRGGFASVRLTACTMDPGTAGPSGAALAASLDGRPLKPTQIWIEADPAAAGAPSVVRELLVDHCVLGAIRTRNGGAVERVEVSDSTIQGIRTSASPALAPSDVYDPTLLVRTLRDHRDAVSQFVASQLPAATADELAAYTGPGPPSDALVQLVRDGLNNVIGGPSIYDDARFSAVAMTDELRALAHAAVGADVPHLNRLLLEAAFAVSLAPLAIGLPTGLTDLSRVTVLGPLVVHSLEASECIFDDLAIAEDTQDGCVRFSAWATGSVLPRQYLCVEIAVGASIFTSRAFGQPGYCQLLDNCDLAIVSGALGATISEGAENGSEVGAFCAGLAKVKERGLLIKFDEYMPLGLTPVVIHAT